MANIIQIPSVLDQILSTDPKLYGAIQITLSDFHPWLRTSGMPFFPGYTDHSDRHISAVLNTASSIITDEARRLLTPADVAVLVLSTLLHDSGMHLTPDGFRNLVDSSEQPALIEGFGDEPWPQLWREFLGEASRFDGRKLNSIFGHNHPIDPHKVDIRNLTEQDHLLIGEFIRRHHARLAHEIALWGVPGPLPRSQRLSFSHISREFADLAGLIARSHNLPIRATYDYLQKNYNIRSFQGIHTVFLMAVLRIADYIQVDSERAEKELLKIKQLRSPLSQREWLAHDAVRDIQSNHEDPEALYIDALPRDIHTYLKLKQLLKDIQSEIDTAWATLGELYGRYGRLEKLGLTIRRIRFNLDNTKDFEKKVNYIPIAVSFESAGTDLLKLLVGPLYGDDPGIGIRELIQNATDACRELEDWRTTHPLHTQSPAKPQEADVIVELEERPDKSRWVTVKDNGIGMTLDVIRNYFLRAGASFRTNEFWRRQHEDAQGRSRVLRGGRFGIGALAAFLIGDEFHVVTRHVTTPEHQAIEFTATLDASALELRHTSAPIGTTIRIRVTQDDIWAYLLPPGPESDQDFSLIPDESDDSDDIWTSVDWYCIEHPSIRVTAKLPSGNSTLKPRYKLPQPGAPLPPGWYRIEDAEYDDVQWTFQAAPALSCNGIIVSTNGTFDYFDENNLDGPIWEEDSSPVKIFRPNLSIFDAQGLLPLNLQRTSITTQSLNFDPKLTEAIARDFVAFSIASATTRTPNEGKFTTTISHLFKYPGFSFLSESAPKSGDIRFEPFLATRNGIILFDKGPINTLGIRRILAMPRVRACSSQTFSNLPPDTAIGYLSIPGTAQNRLIWLGLALKQGFTAGLDFLDIDHVRLAIKADDFELGLEAFPELIKNFKVEKGKESLVILTSPNGTPPENDLFFNEARAQRSRKPAWLFEWTLGPRGWVGTGSPLSDAWTQLIPSQVIPYEPALRRQTLKNTYEELSSQISFHAENLIIRTKSE